MPALTNAVSGTPPGRVVLTAVLIHLLALTACDSERASDLAGPAGEPAGPELHTDVTAAATNGRIVFVSSRDGNREIYTMEPDGSAVTRLTNDAADDIEPAWSPDGARIAFVKYTGAGSEIFLMNADGSGQTKVSNGTFDGTPAWAPDGTRLVFGSLDLTTNNQDIYIMNVDGSGRTRLNTDAGPDLSPSWSPDGTRIVFLAIRGTSSTGDREEIYSMNADGTDQVNLTSNSSYETDPRWSPDGSRIIYIHGDTEASADYEIFVMNRDGSGKVRLTTNTFQENRPTFSPDGTRVVYHSGQTGSDEIWIMNADGSGPVQVTSLFATGNQSPDWQPIPPPPPFAFTGFFAPVDNLPIVNVAKAGRGIPVKFSLGGDEGLHIFRDGFPKFTAAPCDPSDHQDPLEVTTDSPGGLTYSAGSGQYTYVWKTSPGLAGRCGSLELGLTDGSSHSAEFRFTR